MILNLVELMGHIHVNRANYETESVTYLSNKGKKEIKMPAECHF